MTAETVRILCRRDVGAPRYVARFQRCTFRAPPVVIFQVDVMHRTHKLSVQSAQTRRVFGRDHLVRAPVHTTLGQVVTLGTHRIGKGLQQQIASTMLASRASATAPDVVVTDRAVGHDDFEIVPPSGRHDHYHKHTLEKFLGVRNYILKFEFGTGTQSHVPAARCPGPCPTLLWSYACRNRPCTVKL